MWLLAARRPVAPNGAENSKGTQDYKYVTPPE